MSGSNRRSGLSRGKGSGRSSGGKGTGRSGRGSSGSGSRGGGSGGGRRGGAGGRGERQRGGSSHREAGLGGRQVEGRHAVRELLIARRRNVERVWIAAELEGDQGVADIEEIAAAQRVPVEYVGGARLDREARSEAPQGVLAMAAPVPDVDLESLLTQSDPPPLLVALDHITDPGNFGAIVRVADGAGVTGLVVPRHRAVHITPTAAKASAGAIEYVPMALVGGLPTALRQLSERGVWLIGLDDRGARSVFDVGEFAGEPVCVVLGAEGAGLTRLVRERCDVLASIPMAGQVSSLNVSAAAAISLYELSRSRQQLP
ncbi:MAG: 23S rRNA (guanosine(2251)-2'-O)-methyltransferase RlmB [Actinomycetota bacterium]